MDIKNTLAKILDLIKKYRYAVFVLLIGLVLMTIPDLKTQTEETVYDAKEEPAIETSLDDKLSKILSQVDGAGRVQVILTIAAGEEVVYQTDNNETNTADSSAKSTETITITDANRNQNGLIRQVNPALYQGAIIVCEGADNATVHLAIVDAVSKITGLGANRISVLKMK